MAWEWINTLNRMWGRWPAQGICLSDFENQIVRPTVLDDASYACLNYAIPDYIERDGERLLSGLEGREDDYIWQLSGADICWRWRAPAFRGRYPHPG